MPTFSTPTPIDLAINVQVGRIEIVASEREDTVVTVVPANPDLPVDRRAAEETKVDFDGERLTIVGPKPRLNWIGPGPSDTVDVTVELPTGSRLSAELAVGGVRTVGRLGATRIKASTGSVEVDGTAELWMRAGHGNATLKEAEGSVEITADHGQIKIGTVRGDTTLKASHGSVTIGESAGGLDAKLSYGDLEIGRATGSVTAKTSYGDIKLSEVSSGSIQVESGYGQITVGVRPGVPAWLDLSSKTGRVRNELDRDRAPDPSEPTVAVRARTAGDIRIERAR